MINKSIAERDKYYLDIDIKFETIDGEIQLVENTEAVIQNIVFVLFTEKGTIDFEPPDFGCNLSQLVFDSVNDRVLSEYNSDIKRVLSKYVPTAIIRDIKFIIDKDQRSIAVEIYFSTEVLPEVINKLLINTRRRLI